MFYTVYKITNLVNDKIYIGVHKTEDLNDNYMGSGIHLKRSQEKYGIENFSKEILAIFDNPDDMFQMESEIVNEDFVSDNMTYNLKTGGHGGFDYLNKSGKNLYYDNNGNCINGNQDNFKKIIDNFGSIQCYLKSKKDESYEKICLKLSETMKEKYENGFKNPFKDKKHSEEFKESMKGHKRQSGSKNSQFGTMWIHSLELKESKRIPKGDQIPEGWLKGRKIKF